MTQAALSGDYVDLRFIKSRKVCQVIIEIPIEQGNAFVQAFGTPNPATGVPVAIARLSTDVEKTPASEKPKRQWSNVPRAQQAGIACEDPDFQNFLIRCRNWPPEIGNETADVVKHLCGVNSRANLDVKPEAASRWDKLYSDYQLWKRGAAA